MSALRHSLARLLAGIAALTIASIPLSAAAASVPSVDSLWSQNDGISIDSPLYVFQTWWDGWNRKVPDDRVQRGLSELSQANADLLNAFALLQKKHGAAGPQPVPVIDPLLSTAYDAVTGSNTRAPLGSLGNWISQSLLKLEGRDSTDDLVLGLLQDYRAKQAVAMRDLKEQAAYGALLTANAQREADFLTRVETVTTPDDGVDTLLAEANRQTGARSQPAIHGAAVNRSQSQNGPRTTAKSVRQPERTKPKH